MTTIEIKHRITGAVLFSHTAEGNTMRLTLQAAVAARAYLADANLARAYLADAYLAGADLAGAYLAGADLAGAKNLPAGVTASSPAEPYQRDTRAAAERYAERAARFRECNPEVPVVEALDAKILERITAGTGELEMGSWHTCETTHCRAGWAVHLAGAAGYALEQKYGSQAAGRMIYVASVGRVPHFFASNERAMEDLREQAALQVPAEPQAEQPA